MLGMVGDYIGRRVIAWELSGELDVADIVTLEKEVGYYIPSFKVDAVDSDGVSFSHGASFVYTSHIGFIYVDLFSIEYAIVINTVARDDFFKHFKRAF